MKYRVVCIERAWKKKKDAAIKEAKRQVSRDVPEARYTKTFVDDNYWLVEFQIEGSGS